MQTMILYNLLYALLSYLIRYSIYANWTQVSNELESWDYSAMMYDYDILQTSSIE
jgi:hypothetical protein